MNIYYVIREKLIVFIALAMCFRKLHLSYFLLPLFVKFSAALSVVQLGSIGTYAVLQGCCLMPLRSFDIFVTRKNSSGSLPFIVFFCPNVGYS